MINGMTGFSTRAFLYRGKRFVINIRSVNHKFLDYVINLPDGFFNLEAKIKKELSKFLNRGRVTFQLIGIDPPQYQPILNKKLLFGYLGLVKNIGTSLKIKQNIGLTDIINLPEVIYLKKIDAYSCKDFLSVFNSVMQKALKDFLLLRKKEGRAIYLDLTRCSQKIAHKLKLIKNRASSMIEKQKSILGNDELNDFLKNYNVEEEISRLKFHLESFKNTLSQAGPVGKVLDFITQEMQREVNTLSAKFRDSKVSYLSVVIKDEIEKMREQLQNVE